jgi:hypothetical protein
MIRDSVTDKLNCLLFSGLDTEEKNYEEFESVPFFIGDDIA